MFTGLIETLGTLAAVEAVSTGQRWQVETPLAQQLTLGASIALNGVCTTVVQLSPQAFWVELSPETLACTAMGNYTVGQKLNLERPLSLGDPLGGHLVSGHVDGLVTLSQIKPAGDYTALTLQIEATQAAEWGPLLVAKGSVALDGISLTVNRVSELTTGQPVSFEVMIIPHTWQNTTLQYAKPGCPLHFEADLLGKYVQRQLQAWQPA